MNNSFVTKLKITFLSFVFLIGIGPSVVAQVEVIQNNSVGVGTSTPHSSAKLDVRSTTQGFLMPRLNLTQRDAISSPSDGLQVYVTDADDDVRGPYYWDAGISQWVKIGAGSGGSGTGSNVTVGDTPNIDMTLSGSNITSDLTTTGVNNGSYTNTNITVDQFGRLTSASDGGNPSGGQLNSAYAKGNSNLNIPQSVEVVVGSVTITPSDASAKLLLNARVDLRRLGSAAPTFRRARLRVKRGNTPVGRSSFIDVPAIGVFQGSLTFNAIDSPNQTTPVTYDIYATCTNENNLLRSSNWEFSAVELSVAEGPVGPIGQQGPAGLPGQDGMDGQDGAPGPSGLTVGGQNINVSGSGTVGSPYVISSTFAEVDGDITNEIQTLSTSGSPGNVELSNGGGTLNINVDDNDSDPTNEIQTLSTTGNQISITNGNSITVDVNDADSDPTNEFQSLTVNGTTLEISDGNSVTLPGVIGPGTINYVPKWLSTDQLSATSNIYDDGTNVGIGTASPSDPLHVIGRINQSFPDASSNGVALGRFAGNVNNTGTTDVAIGYYAGRNSNSTSNVLIGPNAGGNLNHIYTSSNVFIGSSAGRSAELDGSINRFNVGIGMRAGQFMEGFHNIAIGLRAGESNKYNANNIMIGTSAGEFNEGSSNVIIGPYSGESNQGSQNVMVGVRAGETHTTGSSNVLVGSYATTADGTQSNAVSLGANGTVNASNKVYFHSGGGEITGDVDYTFPSDRRFKININEDVPGLDFVNALNPVTYNFDHKKYKEHLVQLLPDSIRSYQLDSLEYKDPREKLEMGFIAQDVDKVCQDLGIEFSGLNKPDPNNVTSHYTIGYSQFVMPLVKAVQEQQNVIEDQQKIIEAQTKKNVEQELYIENREKLLDDLLKRIEALEKG